MLEGTDYLQFAAPAALWLLALAPVLAWACWRAAKKKREATEAFTSVALAKRLVLGNYRGGYSVRAALLVAALALLVVALGRPRLGSKLERVERKGADILVAIDTSDSMLAQDALPSRLEAAKREVGGLITRLQGDRIGILTFSSEAFLYCPLTADYDAAAMFLGSIDAGITSGAGTALAEALHEGERAFEAGDGYEKAIILVSDGEDWGKGAREAAQALAAKGVKIHAVGVGSDEGAPIPVLDESGNVTDNRRDEGKIVVTRLDEEKLQEIAAAGGGKYYRGGASDLGVAAAYAQIASGETRRAGMHVFRTYAERFQWPLAGALLLIIMEFILRVLPRRRRARAGLATMALLCFLTMSGFSFFETAAALCKRANDYFQDGKFEEAFQRYARALELDSDNPILQFNSGDALYKQEKYAEARDAYGKVGSKVGKVLSGSARFNMGNAYLRESKLDDAIEEYKKALRINPGDELAKRNLEIAQRMKEEQPEDDQDQDQGDEQDENDEQDEQDEQNPEDEQPPEDEQDQSGEDEEGEQPQEQQEPEEQPADAAPMTPEEARALLRQAEYEDAQMQREIVRAMPKPRNSTGKDW